MNNGGKIIFCVLAVLALLGGACSSDDGDDADTDGGSETETEAESSEESSGDDELQNACPADGCQIDFSTIEKDGDELKISWDMNFDPDIANNHIHIYWDNYTASQVSDDATDRGEEQGEWVPTDSTPEYTTDGAVSTSVRGDSTTLCLVAADRDHNVIDESAQVCRDVSEFL